MDGAAVVQHSGQGIVFDITAGAEKLFLIAATRSEALTEA